MQRERQCAPGVTDVSMINLEPFDDMPVMRTAQGREEFEEARKKGVRFVTQRGARRFAGKDGKLRAFDPIGGIVCWPPLYRRIVHAEMLSL